MGSDGVGWEFGGRRLHKWSAGAGSNVSNVVQGVNVSH